MLGNDKVWLDFNDNNNGSNVPLFDGGIFAKVSRLSIGNSMGKSYNNTSSSSSSSSYQSYNSTKSNNSIKSSIPPPPNVTAEQDIINRRNNDNNKLLNFDSNDDFENPPARPIKTHQKAASFNDTSDLLGFDSSPINDSSQSSQKSVSNIDLFGLDTLQPTAQQPTPAVPLSAAPNNNPPFNPFPSMMNSPRPGHIATQPTGFDAFNTITQQQQFPRGVPRPGAPRPMNRPF